MEIKPTKLSIKNSITVTMVDYQLDHNDIGEFDSSPKTFVKGSDKHEWRLQWFPAGYCTRAKEHISLFVEASTPEKKTVTLSETFNMIVETDSSCAFQKLISHEELRRIGGIVDEKVTIVCEGTFNTFNDLQLN
uniref:MATH domain-containing protein n=1 Tax=Panagrellus redivivus TaxID=6233 RepID=A0A7E4WD46_PANRE